MFSVPITACELLWAGVPNSEHVRAGALSLQVFHGWYTTALQERSLSSQVIACTSLIFREFRTGMRHTSLSANPPQQVDVRFTAVLVRIVCDGYRGDHATVLRLIRCVTRLLAPQDIDAVYMFRSSDLSEFLSTIQGKRLSLALTINIKRHSVLVLTTRCIAQFICSSRTRFPHSRCSNTLSSSTKVRWPAFATSTRNTSSSTRFTWLALC